MIFAREYYSPELVSEMMPLWKAHDQETRDELYAPLDPDLTVYSQMEKAGMLRVYTARLEDESLVGYEVFMILMHPHSKGFLVAEQDILYLKPEVRQGLAGYRFMRWCLEQLRMERIRAVNQRVPARSSFGPMLERLGYRIEDLTYSKRLQEVV